MKIIEKTGFNSEEKNQLFRLWNTEYPKSLNYSTLSEFELYLLELKDVSHVLILNEQEKIKGWFFGFIEKGISDREIKSLDKLSKSNRTNAH